MTSVLAILSPMRFLVMMNASISIQFNSQGMLRRILLPAETGAFVSASTTFNLIVIFPMLPLLVTFSLSHFCQR